jgi:hypothetical protein
MLSPPKQVAFAVAAAMLVFFLILWSSVVLMALLRGRTSICPRCKSNRTRPSWPKLSDRLFPRFVVTQRCEFCRKRFFSGKPMDYTKRPK